MIRIRRKSLLYLFLLARLNFVPKFVRVNLFNAFNNIHCTLLCFFVKYYVVDVFPARYYWLNVL